MERARLPVKKDNINKRLQEPLRHVCTCIIGCTAQMSARAGAPGSCCHACQGPTTLLSDMSHGGGKKPQLAQLPTRSDSQSVRSQRGEWGTHFRGPTPVKKKKTATQPKHQKLKNESPTQPATTFFWNSWLVVKRKK